MNFNGQPTFMQAIQQNEYDRLKIPGSFFERSLPDFSIPKQVILRNHQGQEWKVDIVTDQQKYFFTNGWLNFMVDNHVSVGDRGYFILESISPSCLLRVYICGGQSATNYIVPKEEDTYDQQPNNIVDTHHQTTTITITSAERSLSLRRIICKTHLKKMALTKAFMKQAGLRTKSKIVLLNGVGKQWEAGLTSWGEDKTPHIKGWANFARDNHIRIGDEYLIEHRGQKILHVIKIA